MTKKGTPSHAAVMGYRRYDVVLRRQDFDAIRAIIIQGKATMIECTGMRYVYDVPYKGKLLTVVYDDVGKAVVTLLPPGGGRPGNRAKSYIK